jgi:hypothetical protein
MIAASTKLSALFAAKHDGQPSATHPYDVTLILIALALMSIGNYYRPLGVHAGGR